MSIEIGVVHRKRGTFFSFNEPETGNYQFETIKADYPFLDHQIRVEKSDGSVAVGDCAEYGTQGPHPAFFGLCEAFNKQGRVLDVISARDLEPGDKVVICIEKAQPSSVLQVLRSHNSYMCYTPNQPAPPV